MPASAELENCTKANNKVSPHFVRFGARVELTVKMNKGTWWMPWHQESKKDVDGCDKPR